jgi:hypothetical protein
MLRLLHLWNGNIIMNEIAVQFSNVGQQAAATQAAVREAGATQQTCKQFESMVYKCVEVL